MCTFTHVQRIRDSNNIVKNGQIPLERLIKKSESLREGQRDRETERGSQIESGKKRKKLRETERGKLWKMKNQK